jgi:predicted DCC family thiol-disulfide oxidoreductase YuxK
VLQPFPDEPVVLFDGLCHLCSGTVRFILPRDRARRFRFAPLQSEAGRHLLEASGIEPDPTGTIVLIEGPRAWTRSTAVLRIARGMSGLWPLFYLFIAVPRPLRDWVYEIVARNRYRWFGRRDQCFLPGEEDRERFVLAFGSGREQSVSEQGIDGEPARASRPTNGST